MFIHCLVKPKSRMDSVSVNTDGSLRVKIKALPENGKANAYLIQFLANVFDLPQSKIQIHSGHTSSYKRINIVADDPYILSVLDKLKNPV